MLVHSQNEVNRRSLQLRDDTDAADHVVISALVTGVNPTTQELTAQIILQPQGALARDEVTPAVDLKLLINNVREQQQFDFPKGKRINRIEAVFPLNGELNKYPFDHYTTTLWFLITTPTRKTQSQTTPKGAGLVLKEPKSNPSRPINSQWVQQRYCRALLSRLPSRFLHQLRESNSQEALRAETVEKSQASS